MFDFVSDFPWWVWATIGFVVICFGLQNDRVGTAIVLLVAYAMIGTGLYGIWSSGVPQAAVGSFARHVARNQAEQVRVAAIRKDGQDLVFKNVCPDFYEMSWIDRQFSSLSWCNDYRNRF